MPVLPAVGATSSQPDGGLNRFDLTEERPDIVKLVMSPMLKQAGGFRRDMPVGWIWSFSPLVYLAADRIDIRSRVVLLLRSWRAPCLPPKPVPVVVYVSSASEIGVMKAARAAAVDDLLRWLALVIKLPVLRRVLVGRVEDRLLEKIDYPRFLISEIIFVLIAPPSAAYS